MLVKTCNKRCRVVLTGVSRITKKEIHLLNSNEPYGLTHELGSVPLCSLRDIPSSLKLSYATPYRLTHEFGSVPLCSLRDTPSSLKLSYATAKLQFTKLRNFRNPLGRGKSRPATRVEPCPVHGPSRRPEPYKQTLHNGSGASPWSRAQLAPRPGTSGVPEPPRLSSTNKLYNNSTVDAITQKIKHSQETFHNLA